MKKFLTSSDLKVIALITMTIDHIGYFLLPQHFWLRFIGRMAFPLYAFMIGQGFVHTSNKIEYLKRLAFFGIGIEVLMGILSIYAYSRNIFITLAIGLGCLMVMEDYTDNLLLKIPIGLSGLWIAQLVNCDYRWYGVALIFLCYYLRDELWALALAMLGLSYVFEGYGFYVQWFAVVAVIFMYFYNGKLGRKLNYLFFYGYYPLHIVILNLLARYF